MISYSSTVSVIPGGGNGCLSSVVSQRLRNHWRTVEISIGYLGRPMDVHDAAPVRGLSRFGTHLCTIRVWSCCAT